MLNASAIHLTQQRADAGGIRGREAAQAKVVYTSSDSELYIDTKLLCGGVHGITSSQLFEPSPFRPMSEAFLEDWCFGQRTAPASHSRRALSNFNYMRLALGSCLGVNFSSPRGLSASNARAPESLTTWSNPKMFVPELIRDLERLVAMASSAIGHSEHTRVYGLDDELVRYRGAKRNQSGLPFRVQDIPKGMGVRKGSWCLWYDLQTATWAARAATYANTSSLRGCNLP
jgi:hypothetical protein